MYYHLTPDMPTTWQDPLLWHGLPPDYINLLTWLVTCLISSSCHAITWHPAWYTWPVIITFTGTLSCYPVLCTVTWYPVSWSVTCYPVLYTVTWTPEFLIMSCSCYSRKLIINLINHKRNNLHRVGGNMRLSICVRVYSGIRHVVQLKLPVWPVGLQATEGSAGSLLPGTIMIRAYISPSC